MEMDPLIFFSHVYELLSISLLNVNNFNFNDEIGNN